MALALLKTRLRSWYLESTTEMTGGELEECEWRGSLFQPLMDSHCLPFDVGVVLMEPWVTHNEKLARCFQYVGQDILMIVARM